MNIQCIQMQWLHSLLWQHCSRVDVECSQLQAVLVFRDFIQTQSLATTTTICPSQQTILATNFVLFAQCAWHCLFFTIELEPRSATIPHILAATFVSSIRCCRFFFFWWFAFFAGLIPKYESSVELCFFPSMVPKIMILFCRSTATQQHLFLTSALWLGSWNAKPWWRWQHQGNEQKIHWPIIVAQEFSVWKQLFSSNRDRSNFVEKIWKILCGNLKILGFLSQIFIKTMYRITKKQQGTGGKWQGAQKNNRVLRPVVLA